MKLSIEDIIDDVSKKSLSQLATWLEKHRTLEIGFAAGVDYENNPQDWYGFVLHQFFGGDDCLVCGYFGGGYTKVYILDEDFRTKHGATTDNEAILCALKLYNEDFMNCEQLVGYVSNKEWEQANVEEINDWDDEYYTSSATAGDYSPSSPWLAPCMSVSDFI